MDVDRGAEMRERSVRCPIRCLQRPAGSDLPVGPSLGRLEGYLLLDRGHSRARGVLQERERIADPRLVRGRADALPRSPLDQCRDVRPDCDGAHRSTRRQRKACHGDAGVVWNVHGSMGVPRRPPARMTNQASVEGTGAMPKESRCFKRERSRRLAVVGSTTAPPETPPMRGNRKERNRKVNRLAKIAMSRALLAGSIAATAIAPMAHAAGPQPEPPTLPPVFKADAALAPTETVPDAPDGTSRQLAAIVDDLGNRGVFVEDELIVVTNDSKQLNDVLNRWRGEVVDTIDPARNDIADLSPQHLVRVDPTAADPAELPGLLAALHPARDIQHRVSSERAIHVLTVAAMEATSGLTVGINWLATPADIPGGATRESSTGPAGYNTDPAVYAGNAFDWFHLDDGGRLDIGVTQAWTLLARTGRLDARVRLAVLDGGFAPATNGDFPAGWRALTALPVTDTTGTPNPSSCTGGVGCPWHGTAVANAAAGAVHNRAGAAGPAGPVAEPIAIHESADMFNGSIALGLAYGAGARIANMSWSGQVPATLSFTVLPFDLVTRTYRNH